MNNQRIRNIIFDLGGVILNIDYLETEKAFQKLGVKDFDNIYSQSRQTKIFDRFETGKLSPNKFVKELKELAGLEIADREVIDAWNAMLLDLPGRRLELLRKLDKDFRIFLLSNTNAIHYDAFHDIIQKQHRAQSLNPFFEKVYYSHQIGLRKPDTEIFEYVLNENGLLPGETLFIDDSPQHIEGAIKTGLQAYHKNEGDIADLLPRILAEFN